jgi:class 3 adenylate cyclase/pimeloyl-ACP methyl ester carboxylesterase
MARDKAERRLAAIFAADMVGYSRLMEADEDDTIARQNGHRRELIDPKIKDHHGRIVKTTGDGLLVEFSSVLDAVRCAVEVQRDMVEREAVVDEHRRIRYRIGINLGDIVFQDDDVFGDGVNVAARVESLAPPGGVSVSDVVYQSVVGKLDLVFEDGGEKTVKNINKPVHIWNWRADGTDSGEVDPAPASTAPADQSIRFCTASDGVQIAYATVGDGPPLVKAPNWMNHLEYDWESPIWRHLLRALSADHTLVRFDQRGNGLSDWQVPEFTFESMIDDLCTVVDAAGLERFPLLGFSQGCAFSIAYAVRYPERVSKLVLYGGFALGAGKRNEGDRQRNEMEQQMMINGWGQNNAAYRQFFTSLFVPGATKEQEDWFNELQRTTTSPENAAQLRDVFSNVDVTELLPLVSVPTLVLHCRDDGVVPFEAGRRMAAGIPGSKFVSMEGQNHLILENEPAWPRFLNEVLSFLAE